MNINQIPSDTIQQIALIRKVVRSKVKKVGVRNGNGTAYGWVDILAGGDGSRMFTDEERQILETLGIDGAFGNTTNIKPEERKPLLERYVQEGLI